MNQQTIDNKLLAEFMEYTHNGKYITIEDETSYDTDWNWLMPVVVKIQNIKTINTKGYEVWPFKLNATLCEADIKTTYKAVVNFIRWYNKQK